MSIIHFGIVEDNNDPLRVGRCKVRIVGLYDSLKTEDMPWLIPICPTNLDKVIKPPKIGTQVVCLSLDEHNQTILILGIVYGVSDAEEAPDTPFEALGDYPKNWVLESEGGQTISLNDADGSRGVKIYSTAGNSLNLNGNGTVDMPSYNMNVYGNLKVGSGASGSFTDSTGKVITVQNGIITNIFG